LIPQTIKHPHEEWRVGAIAFARDVISDCLDIYAPTIVGRLNLVVPSGFG